MADNPQKVNTETAGPYTIPAPATRRVIPSSYAGKRKFRRTKMMAARTTQQIQAQQEPVSEAS
jgi:hypothetical protein